MSETDPLGEYHVLLAEDSRMRQTLFESWLPELTFRFATSVDEIPPEFDSTIVVACFSETILGDAAGEIRKQIVGRNPYCQLMIILPRGSFVSPYESDYDEVLTRPVLKDDLRETLADGFKRGVYNALLLEFYNLNATLISVQKQEESLSEATQSDVKKIEKRYRALSKQLNRLQSSLSLSDIESISRSIKRHNRYLTEPVDNAENTETSKYHPRRCPNCKLAWGVDHANKLGSGVDSLGAGVWKCARCREIVHGMGDGHRRVM